MIYKDYDALKEWISGKNQQKRIDQLAKKYKGKKAVIYGAGILSSVIFDNYNLSDLNIVGVADQKFFGSDEEFKGCKAVAPYDMAEINPEVIIIATYNTGNVKDFIKEEILPDVGKIPIEPFVTKSLREKISEFLED
ncbi:MAG: hypothetical protein A2287_06205 [Candidatus Melainabacteria bacterium RIFOXYA12_FULL_32_12]|nr:MAG: hypothetical protein A2255_06410 [Candidatus Melainabacteria bacterium RIFOXYA2_FULL_32_9]OGI28202.1 MAG: hypothetical protein A2287_06205 [Candidatus Melainabacteria bacterium RIFOXYA12_FULL_32_12]